MNTLVSLSLKLGLVQSTLKTLSMSLPSSEGKSLMRLRFPFGKREKCREKMLLMEAAATQHNTTGEQITRKHPSIAKAPSPHSHFKASESVFVRKIYLWNSCCICLNSFQHAVFITA